MTVPILRPWPSYPRVLVSPDGTLIGPSGRPLSPFPDKDGYPRINVYRGQKKWSQHSVHVIVCETFHGPRPPGMQVLHGDGDPWNVAAGNLRWGTQKENESDKVDHDRRAWGVRHGMHRLTEDDVRAIRASSESSGALSLRYGVTPDHIGSIRARRCWRHI